MNRMSMQVSSLRRTRVSCLVARLLAIAAMTLGVVFTSAAEELEQWAEPLEIWEMEFVKDTWVCRKQAPVVSGKVFPLTESQCNKVSAGLMWTAYSNRADTSTPKKVAPGVIVVLQPWGGYDGPWYMKKCSLEVTLFE